MWMVDFLSAKREYSLGPTWLAGRVVRARHQMRRVKMHKNGKGRWEVGGQIHATNP
jgi:hypothetical protein